MPRKRRSRLRDLAEYVLVRAVELALWPLCMRTAQRIGGLIGAVVCRVDRRHRVVAERNAAWALGLTNGEVRRLIRRVYRNVGMTFAECLKLPGVLKRRGISEFTRFEGDEHVRAALARGNGLIVITAHIGNWEVAGLGFAEKVGSLLSVARTLDNPLLDRRVREVRERLGQNVVDRDGALRQVIRQLRRGGAVAMLIDQNQREGGVFVDFFGRLASTVPSAASIALKHDVPVIPGYGCRSEDGSAHYVRCEEPFEIIRTGDHEADVVANTAQFTRRIEEWVRRHPDQWFWLHQRWRKRPPEEEKAMKAQQAAQGAGSAVQ